MEELRRRAVLFKHSMIELLRRVVMKGGVEGRWVDLVEESFKLFKIGLNLCFWFGLVWYLGHGGCGEESEEQSGWQEPA